LDAKSHGAHKYIFLGDYVHGFPWGNDVTNAIRRLETATVIRGNGEGYLIETGRRLNKTEYPVSNEVWDAVGRIPTLEYELPLL